MLGFRLSFGWLSPVTLDAFLLAHGVQLSRLPDVP